MKKTVCLILALTMLFSLAACGSTGSSGSGSSGSSPAPASSGGSSGGSTAASEVIIGHDYQEGHPTNTSVVNFGAYLSEQTNGAFTLNNQGNSVLGSDEDMIEMCAMGSITMCLPSVASLETYDPAWGICCLPFLYNDIEHSNAAMDGEVGEYLKKTLDKQDFLVLGFASNGIRNMTNDVRPITKVDDLKGIKMRVMNSNTYIEWMNALGANATPVGFNELFTALQQGTVDGQENGADLIYDNAFYEAQKYLSVTQHIFDCNAVVCNRAWYEGLSSEQRAIVDKGVADLLVAQQRAEMLAEDENYIQKLSDKGMEVNKLDDAAKETFRAELTDIYQKSREKLGDEIWNMVEKYR